MNTSAAQTFSITVNPVNDVPSFVKGANQTVNEDAGAQSVSGWATSISKGPANESGQAVDFIVSNDNTPLFSVQPAIAANGTLTYTPAPNASGAATVTVQIHDDGGTNNGGVNTSAAQTFTITVDPLNDAPICDPVTLTTDEDVQGTEPWSCSDVDGDALTIAIASQGTKGSASVTGSDLVYLPDANEHGADSFTYTATDPSSAESDPATASVWITPVNDDPTARDDSATVDEDSSVNHIDVLANDDDAPDTGETLSVSAVTQGAHGSVTYSSTDVAYTPDPDYFGDDTFTYTISDGNGGTATATVSVSVTSINDAPVLDLNGGDAGVDTSVTFTEDGPAVVLAPGLTLSDADPGQLMHAASVQLTIDPPSGTVVPDLPDELLTGDVAGACSFATTLFDFNTTTGTLLIIGDATVAEYRACLRTITYEDTLDAMDVTVRNAEFTVFDATGEPSNRPDATITLVPVNDAPVATDGTEETAEDDPAITVDLRDLVSDAETGDADLDYDVDAPAPAEGTIASGGPNGTFSFTPAPDFNGTVVITYTVTDRGDPDDCSPVDTDCDDVETSLEATVTITVTEVNDAPSADDDAATVAEDGSVDVDVQDGDSTGPSNESGQSLTTTRIVSGPDHGTATILGSGEVRYEPADDYNGPDSFVYEVCDDGTTDGDPDPLCATAEVTIDRDPRERRPHGPGRLGHGGRGLLGQPHRRPGQRRRRPGHGRDAVGERGDPGRPRLGHLLLDRRGLHPGPGLLRGRHVHLHDLRRQRRHRHRHGLRLGDLDQRRPGPGPQRR